MKEDLSFEEFLEKQNKGLKGTPRSKHRTEVRRNYLDRKNKKVKKKAVTYTTEKEFDFLKYWFAVRYHALNVVFEKKISPGELRLLLFLYSEPPFTRKDFLDHEEFVTWNKHRLDTWIKEGIIDHYKIKNPKNKKGNLFKLYTLSKSTKRKIRSIYDKLLLRYKISETPQNNPMFRPKSRGYADKVYAKKVKQINSGKYNTLKQEDDWDDINDLSFKEFVDEYNKTNYEVMPDHSKRKED